MSNENVPVLIISLKRLSSDHIYQILPMSDIQEKVTQILVEKIGIAHTEATLDANFIKDLGIDSLDYAEIVMEFEQTFHILNTSSTFLTHLPHFGHMFCIFLFLTILEVS